MISRSSYCLALPQSEPVAQISLMAGEKTEEARRAAGRAEAFLGVIKAVFDELSISGG